MRQVMSREEAVIELAKYMHDEYEQAAKALGWDTQKSCKVPFENLPQKNKDTMMYVAGKVYEKYIESEPEPEPTVRTVEKVIYKEVDKLHKEINRLTAENKARDELIKELVSANPNCCWRKCWGCGKIQIHQDDIVPGVLCRFCGSQDTRLLKEETQALKEEKAKNEIGDLRAKAVRKGLMNHGPFTGKP